MLILGIRVSTVLLATLLSGCDRCGQHAPHDVVKRQRKLTVFFVPLVPVGTRYLDTCSACGHVRTVSGRQALAAAR